MKIDSGTVQMGSSRRYSETSVVFRRFTLESRQVTAGGGNILDGAMGGNAGNAEGAEKDQEGQGEDKARR